MVKVLSDLTEDEAFLSKVTFFRDSTLRSGDGGLLVTKVIRGRKKEH